MKRIFGAVAVGLVLLVGYLGYAQLSVDTEALNWGSASDVAADNTAPATTLPALPGETGPTTSTAPAVTTAPTAVATTAVPRATPVTAPKIVNRPTVSVPKVTGTIPRASTGTLPAAPTKAAGWEVVEMSPETKAAYVAIMEKNPDKGALVSYDPKNVAYNGQVVAEAVNFTIIPAIAAIPNFDHLFLLSVEAEIPSTTRSQVTIAGQSVYVVRSSTTGETCVVWVRGNQVLTVDGKDYQAAGSAMAYLIRIN